MSRDDYEAISKIIEEVVGKDTSMGVTLLEGIRFYFNNKVEKIKIVNKESRIPYKISKNHSMFRDEANKAMERYTKKLNKENKKFREKRDKACAISGWD